jgi:small neutral amino acid transporter SnatA (MarC family)
LHKKKGERFALPLSIRLLKSMTSSPAPIATTPAITPIAVPATASAPSTTTAASATAESPAAAATAAGPPAATAATFARRPRFIDHDIAAHKILAVQSLNGALSFLIAIDLDESEAARLAREAVAHQGHVRRSDARLRK